MFNSGPRAGRGNSGAVWFEGSGGIMTESYEYWHAKETEALRLEKEAEKRADDARNDVNLAVAAGDHAAKADALRRWNKALREVEEHANEAGRAWRAAFRIKHGVMSPTD